MRKKKIDIILERILRANTPYGISKDSFDKLIVQNAKDKRVFEHALTILSRPLRALLRLNIIYDEMLLLFRIAHLFPWKGVMTKFQHMHFVWLLFVNLCYSFEEKFKLYANEHNAALKSFGLTGGVDIKTGIKKIDSNLREHIRNRGEQMHEWRKTHDALDDFAIIELAATLEKGTKEINSEQAYRMAKIIVAGEIRSAIAFLELFLMEVVTNHEKELLPISKKIVDTLKALKAHNSVAPD